MIFNKTSVIEPSRLGIMVDGTNLGDGPASRRQRPSQSTKNTPAVESTQAINHCKGCRRYLQTGGKSDSSPGGAARLQRWRGIRYLVPGGQKDQRTADEVTSFTVPEGAFVWYHDFEGHYEGLHQKKEISQVQQGRMDGYAADHQAAGQPRLRGHHRGWHSSITRVWDCRAMGAEDCRGVLVTHSR